MNQDEPSPIDLRLVSDAREWEQSAMQKRPWRAEFFERFANEITALAPGHVLELGSGPGFLAEHLLRSNSNVTLSLLDFSAAMHELARVRLKDFKSRVRFVERNFKEPSWGRGLGVFGCVVTNQAVHELRHKSYAATLHTQVRSLLLPGGLYLVCDHFAGDGGMTNERLYMSVTEQRQALLEAGFISVCPILIKGGMVLHRATDREHRAG